MGDYSDLPKPIMAAKTNFGIDLRLKDRGGRPEIGLPGPIIGLIVNFQLGSGEWQKGGNFDDWVRLGWCRGHMCGKNRRAAP